MQDLFTRKNLADTAGEQKPTRPPRVCLQCGRLTPRHLAACQQCKVVLEPGSVQALIQVDHSQQVGYWPVGIIFSWVVLLYMIALGLSALDDAYLAPHHGWSPKPDVLTTLGANQADLTLNATEYWRLGTAIFLHQNLIHAAFNLCLLAWLGGIALRHFEARRVLLTVLLSGFIGNIFAADAVFLGFPPFHNMGLASSLFGLTGLLAGVQSPFDPLLASRMKALLIWGFLTFTGLSLLQITPIDHFGHLGGLLTGMGLGYWYSSNIANGLGHHLERLVLLAAGLFLIWGGHQQFLKINALLTMSL